MTYMLPTNRRQWWQLFQHFLQDLQSSRHWTRLSLLSPTPNQKLQQPREADVEGEGVEDAAAEEVAVTEVQRKLQAQDQSIKAPSILTFLLEIGLGVGCTSNGGSLLFSVQNPQLVHGGTSSHQNLQRIIDNLTSSASANQL